MTTEQNMLQRALGEIQQLRRQNELMSARLGMYDQMMLLFTSQPAYQGMAVSPDIAWEIQRHLEHIETQESKPQQNS